MGWIDCSGDEWRYEHEGYMVGVTRIYGSSQWRELGADDRSVQNLAWVQVGCECGWRSRRMAAPVGTAWTPCCVTLPSEADDDAGRAVWARHVHDEASVGGSATLRFRQQIASR